MSPVATCPTPSQFLGLAEGRTDGAQTEALLRHCLQCRECGEALARLGAPESLLSRMRMDGTLDEKTLTPEVVERCRADFGAAALERTPIAGAPQEPTLTEEEELAAAKQWSNLLQPPLDANELGWLAHYRVLKVLGTGGMGRVFLAEDTHLKRPVALKVMNPALLHLPSARERFLREARAAAAVVDEHIVTIYQVGQADDVPFLAMELLQGESLAQRLERERTLAAAEAARIGADIAAGLAVAHGHGLVHRDIKPANLWLERPAVSPTPAVSAPAVSFRRVKILDFGLARAADGPTHLTATGQVMGTPHYMAPEQARGEAVDGRSDLFSLGCVLYRALSGKEPFEGPTVMAVLSALATREPRDLRESCPHLPEDFVRLVEQLLKKDPKERPAGAEEVATRLRALETEARRRGDETTLATPRLQNVAGATQENGGAGQENGANASTLVRPAAGVTQSAPIEPLWRRPFLLGAFFTALILGGFGFFLIHSRSDVQADDRDDDAPRFTGPPIRVGILQSTSGTMADSGSAVVDATLLAIEEINKAGGIKGRPIEYLLRDGESDADSYAEGAERLIAEDKVSVIFGCWTSSGRKRVMPIVEKHHSLLLYPVQYEGLESSPNIVYLGGTPNQQILPAVRFCFAELGKRRFFLVGSDYIFPHAANEIIKDELKRLGATVVGEDYVPLGESNVQPVIDRILKSRADVILNTINGDSNRPFFRRLRQAGITPEKVPTVSFSIAEPELRLLGTRDMAGDYVACSYFMSLGDEANREFVKKFRARFGPERVTSDPMLAAYASVHVWAEAVAKAQTAEPKQVLAQLRDADFDGPGGTIKIDPKCLHAWKRFRMGRIDEGGRIEVLWSSEVLLAPEPFLPSRTRAEWETFLSGLYRSWGGHWENAGN